MDERAQWLISKSGAIEPPSGSYLDTAYLVKVVRGASTRDVIVEFAETSAVVSIGYAEEVARPFLREVEPPQRLGVDSAGSITVLLGPRRATEPEPQPVAHIEPRRARNHRRGT